MDLCILVFAGHYSHLSSCHRFQELARAAARLCVPAARHRDVRAGCFPPPSSLEVWLKSVLHHGRPSWGGGLWELGYFLGPREPVPRLLSTFVGCESTNRDGAAGVRSFSGERYSWSSRLHKKYFSIWHLKISDTPTAFHWDNLCIRCLEGCILPLHSTLPDGDCERGEFLGDCLYDGWGELSGWWWEPVKSRVFCMTCIALFII